VRRPDDYGAWWNAQTHPRAWYEAIDAGQAPQHEAFERWYRERATSIGSVLEIGCGAGVRYPSLFHDKRYMGIDVSRPAIDECLAHALPGHDFTVGDIADARILARFDLVFSHAVLDHVYDVELFLEASVRASCARLYHTAYSGWFPEEREHVYTWSTAESCYYNRLSPGSVREQLDALGWRAACLPSCGGTMIIAEVTR
jgi:SAM-dependent methyltransferase